MLFFFFFFKGWIGALKNVAGLGLAGGGARRARALLLSCAVQSAAPGGPARRSSARGRYCCRRRRRRSMAAPAPRPHRVPLLPARVPGERWSGVGPVCLPPAPSPESRSPSERKEEDAGGGGGGLERQRGRAEWGPPPCDLPRRGRGSSHCLSSRPGPLPRLESREAQPVTCNE